MIVSPLILSEMMIVLNFSLDTAKDFAKQIQKKEQNRVNYIKQK